MNKPLCSAAAPQAVGGIALCFKLPSIEPAQLPSGGVANLLGAYGPPPSMGRQLAASGALRPGCTLLTLDITTGGRAADSTDVAHQAAAAALSGPHAAFLRSLPTFSVSGGGQTVTCEHGVITGSAPISAAEAALPLLLPLAVVSSRPQRLRSALPVAVGGALNCRVHGVVVRAARAQHDACSPTPKPAGSQQAPARPCALRKRCCAAACQTAGAKPFCAASERAAPRSLPSQVQGPEGNAWAPAAAAGVRIDVELPATSTEGCALFDLMSPSDASAPRCTKPAAVLLTASPALAAEVAQLEAEEARDPHEVRSVLLALGHALRPGCPLALLLAASEAAVQRDWHATAARLLVDLVDELEAAPPGEATRTAASIIFAAMRSREPMMLRTVLEHGGPKHVLGGPLSVNAAGQTPLHLVRKPPLSAAGPLEGGDKSRSARG